MSQRGCQNLSLHVSILEYAHTRPEWFEKYSLAKFANFVYFCIACGNSYHIWAENGSNFRTQYKSIQNLQISQGETMLYRFCKPSISDLKTVNSNAFR